MRDLDAHALRSRQDKDSIVPTENFPFQNHRHPHNPPLTSPLHTSHISISPPKTMIRINLKRTRDDEATGDWDTETHPSTPPRKAAKLILKLNSRHNSDAAQPNSSIKPTGLPAPKVAISKKAQALRLASLSWLPSPTSQIASIEAWNRRTIREAGFADMSRHPNNITRFYKDRSELVDGKTAKPLDPEDAVFVDGTWPWLGEKAAEEDRCGCKARRRCRCVKEYCGAKKVRGKEEVNERKKTLLACLEATNRKFL